VTQQQHAVVVGQDVQFIALRIELRKVHCADRFRHPLDHAAHDVQEHVAVE